jgi:hypothetical protein
MIFDSNKPWMISANGTIFSYETEGIIPGLLSKWYSDRKVLQRKKALCSELSIGIDIDDDLANLLNHTE